MDPDLTLVIGMIIGVFSVPSILSAISDARAPRVATLTIVVSGALILWAVSSHPGGYSLEDVPEVIVRVAARFLN